MKTSVSTGKRYVYLKVIILILFVILAIIGLEKDYKLVRSFVQIICRACIGLIQAILYI